MADTITTTVRKVGTVIQSVPPGDAPWTELAAVGIEDPWKPTDPVVAGQYGKCVLEYGGAGVDSFSEWLICSNFGFELPESAEVINMILEVKKASAGGQIKDWDAYVHSDTKTFRKIGVFSDVSWGGGYWDTERYALDHTYWTGSPPTSVSYPPEDFNNLFALIKVVRDHYAGFGDSTAQIAHVVLEIEYSESYLNLDTFGGAILGGTHISTSVKTIQVSGGAQLAGESPVYKFLPIDGGKVVGGGTAIISDQVAVDGGIATGGTADNSYIVSAEASGGPLLGGTSPVESSFIPEGVGLLAGGNSVPTTEVSVGGGINHSGVSANVATFFTELSSLGMLIIRTSASINSTSNHEHVTTGSVSLGSSTEAALTGVRYQGSGGVYVSSVLNPVVVDFQFNKDLTCTWQTRTAVTKDINFLWDTGPLTMYWYRIVGQGIQDDPCQLEECCQKFIVNIHARSLAEVCEKLSERNWNWPIQTMEKFSIPAETDLAEQYIDLYGECNDLTPVEFCDIPQCATYCVDVDARVTFDFSMSGVADGFLQFTSGNGTADERTIYVGDSADATYDDLTPDYGYSPIDSEIYVSGSAVASPDWFWPSGGAKVSGQAQIGFPRWEYVGGEWPFDTDVRYALDSTSNKLPNDGTSDSPWFYPENATIDDGNSAESDISYSQTTESLIVRNFRLNLPSDATIVGFEVYVTRWSSQTATHDAGLVLLDGTRELSYDFSEGIITWPLIPTTAIYGDDEIFDGLNIPVNLVDGTWDVSILNSSDFGVAFKATDLGGLGGAYAYVDSIGVRVYHESPEHQILRIGGEAKTVTANYHYVPDSGIDLGGTSEPYKRSFICYPTGIGEGQPTTFVIGGNYATKFYYEVGEENTVWWDKGDPVNTDNTGTVAYSPTEAESVNRSILFGNPVLLGAVVWQYPEKALITDSNYAYGNVGSLPYSTDFLVVRDFEFDEDIEDHVKIHGIRIVLGSVASTKDSVYEDYVYLVKGNSIISDNLAKSGEWTTTPAFNYYGSTGFDGSTQFRDIELNPWSVQEIINEDFGFAIAVHNADTTSGTNLAKVDGVTVELTLEAYAMEEVSQSHIRMIGSAEVDYDHRSMEGGASCGGFAVVKPYWITMDGGVDAGGHATMLDDWVFDATGEVTISGSAPAYEANLNYLGKGGAYVNGDAHITSNRFDYTSDGNAIFILGAADVLGTSISSGLIDMQADMEVLNLGGVYTEYSEDGTIDPLSSTISSCGCLSIPLVISVQHNIDVENILNKFLIRNDYYLANDLELHYNVPNLSWQYNAHYTGYSADANTREKWDLVFEVQCLDEMGGVDIGTNVWKLSISVFRKNLTTGEDYDSRMIFGLLPDAICGTTANELDFSLTYNTLTQGTIVTPSNATIYQATLYDNIGLFKTQYWDTYPNLVLKVSQSGFALPQTRYDLYDAAVPEDESVPIPSS